MVAMENECSDNVAYTQGDVLPPASSPVEPQIDATS